MSGLRLDEQPVPDQVSRERIETFFLKSRKIE